MKFTPGVSGIHLMYCVSPGATFSRLSTCEVNLIHNYGYMGISYLDKALAAGVWVHYDLKPLIGDVFYHDPDKSAAHQTALWNENKAEVATWINEVKNHPALHSYHIFNEPNLAHCPIDYDLQKTIYDYVKSKDPNHYVSYAMAGGPGGLGYASCNMDACDFLLPDTYEHAGVGWACQQLRKYFDDHPEVTEPPLVFTVCCCDEPQTEWYGNIRNYLDLVDLYNVGTGGHAMWAWMSEGRNAENNDEVLNEIKDAWGASTWGPPLPVYTCPYCGATFDTEGELEDHIASVHPPVPEYTCPYCGATFTSQIDLDNHIATEHPVPVFTCPHCGATFATQSELDDHIAAVHPIAAEVPWYKKYAPFLAIGGAIGAGVVVGAALAKRKK